MQLITIEVDPSVNFLFCRSPYTIVVGQIYFVSFHPVAQFSQDRELQVPVV
jgi:hypothetical protein